MEVHDPEALHGALEEYHQRIAGIILDSIAPLEPRSIVEMGAGSGHMTIPILIQLDGKFREYLCVDPYTGPYSHDRCVLESRLRNIPETDGVTIIQFDIADIEDHASDVDLILGHDVFCDLQGDHIERILASCFNILKDDGFLIHTGFSPIATTESEKLVHLINEHAMDPISDTTWFSPGGDYLASIAHRTGFRGVDIRYERVNLRFKGDAAIEMARVWSVSDPFLGDHENEIRRIGIAFPMEQILICRKSDTK